MFLYDGLPRDNWCVHSPTRIDFTNFINQVQLMLFAIYFLFFPPGESALISSFQIIDNLQSCIPFRLFKATLQRIAANLRAGCADAHTAH